MSDDSTFTIRIPGSTSNLGAGFDCFGLALKLYLTVRVTRPANDGAVQHRIVVASDAEGESIPTTPDNLILQTAEATATSLGLVLPAVEIEIRNEIPLGRGLGSSAAAIVAGVAIGGRCCGMKWSAEEMIARAAVIEGHADNVAASVTGGRVICYQDEGENFRAMKLPWPAGIRVIIISPELPLATKTARAILPALAPRADAIFNLQRSALLTAALDQGSEALIWEAMRDQLHQPYRAHLLPGLALALATARRPGLLGLALSGAGPSIVALARDNFAEIGDAIAGPFRREGIAAAARILEVDDVGIALVDESG